MLSLSRSLSVLITLLLLLVSNVAFANCGPNCPPNCSCGCAEGKCPPNCKCGCDMPNKGAVSKQTPEQKRPGKLSNCSCGPSCPKDDCGCGCDHGYTEEEPYNDPNCPCENEEENVPIHIILSAANEDHSQECGYKPCAVWGQWFPDNPVLFRQFMADPRALIFSAAWRFNDQALFKNTIPVSYYDTCVFYRWYNVWPWKGDLQIELEGCLWAVFNPLGESSPLINADYYVGIPITYGVGPWAFRLRGFHISSHIGDEFLLQHPFFCRRNPSAEYLDFFISYDYTDEIRFYSGLGYIVAQDDSFIQKRFYSAIGTELRLLELGFVDHCQRVYGAPIFGMHFRQQGDFGNRVDSTYILGYEFGKLTGEYKKLRFFLEYHDGYSVEGQFSRLKTNYLAIKMTYGY